MRRRLSPDEVGLWRRAMHDVVPLHDHLLHWRHRPAPSVPAPSPPTIAKPEKPVRAVPPPPPVPLLSLDRFAGLDRSSAERLKRGRYPIEARLDLHGLTQDEAHAALGRFIGVSRAHGRRCVLVITGHGRMSGGILKAAVPRWLNEAGFRHELLAVTPAQPRDGGSAALYLLLRRTRETAAPG